LNGWPRYEMEFFVLRGFVPVLITALGYQMWLERWLAGCSTAELLS